MNKRQIKPVGNKILVKMDAEEGAVGRIIIPEKHSEISLTGTVVSVGTGKTKKNGKRPVFEVAAGDRVVISPYGATEVKIDGEFYKSYDYEDAVLAILN